MMLLIDIGNTRIKWAWQTAQGLVGHGAAPHAQADFNFDVLAVKQSPTRIVFVSGVPRLTQALLAWLEKAWPAVEVQELKAQAEAFGIRNRYREPARLGADRWAALIGARALIKGALCIVDCGTAMTFNALNARDEFIGGAIAPGLGAAQRCLEENTHGIARGAAAAHGVATTALALNTDDAVAAGVHFGCIGAVERIVAEYRNTLGQDMRVVLTGGDHARLLAQLNFPCYAVHDLVLRGLAHVAAA